MERDRYHCQVKSRTNNIDRVMLTVEASIKTIICIYIISLSSKLEIKIVSLPLNNDGFVKSLFTGHCEERSGCEADPKQTRSLSFRTEKYNT